MNGNKPIFKTVQLILYIVYALSKETCLKRLKMRFSSF